MTQTPDSTNRLLDGSDYLAANPEFAQALAVPADEAVVAAGIAEFLAGSAADSAADPGSVTRPTEVSFTAAVAEAAGDTGFAALIAPENE